MWFYWHFIKKKKKSSATGSASDTTDLNVANAMECYFNEWYSFWNLRFLVD